MEQNKTTEQLLNQALQKIRQLEEELHEIREKVDRLENPQLPQTEAPSAFEPELNQQIINEIDLMGLPQNLRKTMFALAKLREATPEEVAAETNRTRGLENIYLNQLELLGYVEKIKRGKRVYYRSLRTR